MSKTPQFDAALDAILASLRPHERICKQCSTSFSVHEEDVEFYHMLRVPPPTLCPLCRKKRRFAHHLRLPKFFKKKCEAPGHSEEVITIFPPGTPHRVCDFGYWYSDAWDATEFEIAYNSSLPFFSQFKHLFFQVPHLPLERDPKGAGVDYSIGGLGGNNTYYCSMAYETENAAYCLDALFCRDVVDCNALAHSELCYESVASSNSARCIAILNSAYCVDCAFVYDCKNCTRCFMSSSLRNRSYVFRNKQLSREEYEKTLFAFPLMKRSVFQECKREFEKVFRHSLHRSLQNRAVSQSVGNYLLDCNKCFFVFRGENSEQVRYSDLAISLKDSMDVTGGKGDRAYECVVSAGSNNRFSLYVRDATNLEYSYECHGCHYCFGCVGLRNKQFHIFNRPYAEQEYWDAIDAIKTKMLANGEYGEFFPLSLGLVPYQSTTAQKNFPLSEEEARRGGILWYAEPPPTFPSHMNILNVSDVPDDIRNVRDDIVECALVCEKTGKPFRLVPSELAFYKRMGVPVPTTHPFERIMERVQFERPPLLYPFTCPLCKERSFAAYPPDEQSSLRILCEPCYLKETV